MKNLIVILLILSWCEADAQTIHPSMESKSPVPGFYRTTNYQELWKTHFETTLSQNGFLFQKPSTSLFLENPNHLSGMFCKMEYKMETKSKLASRFRLGSLNYTNWMEGKGEYYSRYWK